MDEPQPKEPLAWIKLELRDENNTMELAVKGNERQLVNIMSATFTKFPELLESFDKAKRHYQIFRKRKDN